MKATKMTMGSFSRRGVFGDSRRRVPMLREGVTCKVERQARASSHTGTDGSACAARCRYGGGKSKAIAKTGGDAEASSDTHGKSNAIATEAGTAKASADTEAGQRPPRADRVLRTLVLTRTARRRPMRAERALRASADSRPTRPPMRVIWHATRRRTEVQVSAQPQQTPTSSGTATAQCEAGGFARATATGGGTAEAFDDAAPVVFPRPAPRTPRPCKAPAATANSGRFSAFGYAVSAQSARLHNAAPAIITFSRCSTYSRRG